MEELRVGSKGKSTDSRIIFSAGQGAGSSCSINHPTELISQQWLEKQFCESEFYRHQQQKKSGCSSFNSKTSRRKMVHIYITETNNLKTWIPQYPFCQLKTNYFTCPYASPNSKLLAMVGNVTKSENQTVIINRDLYVASESISANTSMEPRVAASVLPSKMPTIMHLKTNMPTAVPSSATHCDVTICYDTSKGIILCHLHPSRSNAF